MQCVKILQLQTNFITESTHLLHQDPTEIKVKFSNINVTLALFFRRVDNAIHRINPYPEDNAVRFRSPYPLHSDLSIFWTTVTWWKISEVFHITPWKESLSYVHDLAENNSIFGGPPANTSNFQIISRWDDKVKGNYKYDLLP